MEAGGEALESRMREAFAQVNIAGDGEITAAEFQLAITGTDVFVQVKLLW